MTRHERVYRRLLAVYPASFRERYAEEMVTLFVDELWEARASGGGSRVASLWLRSVADLAATAPRQHFRKEELVPRPLDPAAMAMDGGPARYELSKAGYALALLPLWTLILLRLVAPGYTEPLFLNPPEILGLPAGIVSALIAMLLMAFGVLMMRWAGSAAERTAAFLLFTIPSLIIVVVAPAFVVAVVNLNI